MPMQLTVLHGFSVLMLERPAALNALEAVCDADSRRSIITGGGKADVP